LDSRRLVDLGYHKQDLTVLHGMDVDARQEAKDRLSEPRELKAAVVSNSHVLESFDLTQA
jgi:hypothetical protein